VVSVGTGVRSRGLGKGACWRAGVVLALHVPPVDARVVLALLSFKLQAQHRIHGRGRFKIIGPLACDGDPPKLVNRDNKERAFKVECGSKSENRRIAAGESLSLPGKSRCLLVFGDQSVTLYVDLVCVIRNSKLSCELT